MPVLSIEKGARFLNNVGNQTNKKRKAPVENLMLEAHKLQAQGLTQKEIAAAINRSERTVRNYLSEPPRKRRRPVRPSKLDPYKPFIKSVIDENPGCNGAKVHERICAMGFNGKSSIVREYLEGNFFVDYEGLSLKLEELNESAAEWISRIKKNRLSQFNESREERFAREQKLLNRIPADGFDVRDEITAVVNSESCITYRTNKYSVNPCYIGRKLIVRPSVTSEQIEITDADGQSIRIVECEKAGSRKVILFDDDRRLINAYWETGLRKDMPARCARKPERPEVPEVQVRLPSDYDAVLPEAAL